LQVKLHAGQLHLQIGKANKTRTKAGGRFLDAHFLLVNAVAVCTAVQHKA
jgi:hypothetical protein